MSAALEAMKGLKKKFGDKTVTVGITMYEAERIPTGIFELDYATGGGLPRGRLTEIFGVESSGKTNIVLKAMRQAQKLQPDSYVVFIDAENAMTGEWMVKMGVNPDRLIYIRPDYGEQVIESADKFLEAEDVSLLLIDSTAGLVGINELEADAEKVTPGNSTQLIQRLIKRCISAIQRSDKAYEEGERKTPAPAWVMINQTRMKIGVMFGSPESTPGGNAPKFAAALRIRIYGKNLMDPKISKTLPAYKNIKAQLIKWKVPVLATEAEFDMAMIPNPDLDLGDVDSWGLVENLLKHHGFLAKDPKGKGWWLNTDDPKKVLEGLNYPTLKALHEQYSADFVFRTALHGDLFLAGRKEAEGNDELEEGEVPGV